MEPNDTLVDVLAWIAATIIPVIFIWVGACIWNHEVLSLLPWHWNLPCKLLGFVWLINMLGVSRTAKPM